MKRILLSVCIGSLALGITAWGAQKQQTYGGAKRAQHASSAQSAAPRSYHRSMNSVNRGTTQRSLSATRYHPQTKTNHVARLNSSNSTVHRNNVQHARVQTSQNFNANNAKLHARNNVTTKRDLWNRGHGLKSGGNDVAMKSKRNFDRNRNGNINRQKNVKITNNWKGDHFRGQNYAAFRNYHREWHNRDWWHHHCSNIVFISGGWWGWNAGYWYPAWGYDPYYTYYPYDGPIYTGAATLSPDQVIVNVQQQLQSDGYYAGPIDGVLGPMTRAAIANYQADHGLAVTSAVDEPTLATMGIV
jgi:Putative peptidoglycan binding domain